jgi:hypothetical protein
MNPSNAVAFLLCIPYNSASVIVIYTALALFTQTTISAFIAHNYIHSGPKIGKATGGANVTSSSIPHLAIIQRYYTARHQFEKIRFNGLGWSRGHVS